MAERTPFERVFNPDYPGSLTGILGGLMGNKTTAERYGELQANALRKFSELNTAGDPQRAFMELLKTPEGMAVFQSGDPNAMKQLGEAIKNMTPPTPTMSLAGPNQTLIGVGPGGKEQYRFTAPSGIQFTTTAPGQTTTAWQNGQQAGSVSVQGTPQSTVAGPGSMIQTTDSKGNIINTTRNPTADTQNFINMAQWANLPAERLAELAEYHLIPDQARQFDMLNKLEKSGVLSPQMAALLTTGMVEVKQLEDHWGKKTNSFALVNKATGQVTLLRGSDPNAPANTPRVPGAEPGAAPTQDNPAGIIDPKKTGMFLGTGVFPSTLHYLNQAVETTFGTETGTTAGQLATERRRMIQDVDAAVTSVPAIAGRSNVVINSMRQLLPKLLNGALDSVNAGIQLHNISQREIEAAERVINDNDPTVSPKLRSEESERLHSFRRVQRALPPLSDMQALKMALLKDGAANMPGMEGGEVTAKTAGKAIMELGGKAVDAAASVFSSAKGSQGVPQVQGKVPMPPRRIGDISKMSFEQLSQLPVDQLTPAQRQQALARIKTLRQGLAQ